MTTSQYSSTWPRPTVEERTWRSDLTAYPKPPRVERDPYLYAITIPPEIAGAQLLLPGPTTALLEQASQAVTNLNRSAGAGHYELVAGPLLRSEAVASSKIEGLRASHRALAEAREVPGVAKANAVAILNNVRAMEKAIDLAQQGPLTIDTIRDVHGCLAAGTSLEPHAGRLRDQQNWIGPSNHGPYNALYVPPPAQLVERLLDDLVRFAGRTDIPAIVQAGIVHAQFEAIHPFVDGNGRVGRTLIHAVLRRRGLSSRVVPISTVLASRREEYFSALAQFQRDGEVVAWTDHFTVATAAAARHAEDLGVEITELVEDWRARIGRRHADAATGDLLPALVQHPVISAATAAQRIGVTGQSSRRILGDLEQAGVVRQITAGRRNRVWAVDEVFDLLDRFEHTVAAGGDGTLTRPA
jgi:Fic family protein